MKNFLIVDDHPAVRFALKIQLTEIFGADVAVLEADNSLDVFSLLRLNVIRLVLLDLDLPGIPGLELISRIRSSYPDIGILVISSFEQNIYARRCLANGANGFLNKRESLLELKRAVQTVLDGYAFFTSDIITRRNIPADDAALSEREFAILKFLSIGTSNNEIAAALFISNKTVSTYKVRIMKKLGVRSLIELIDVARQRKLL